MQPSRTCLVLFHQPSPWKLASSSSSFPPSFSFLRLQKGNQRERERQRHREKEEEREKESGTVTQTELSEALRGNKQSNLLCFSTFFPVRCSLPPPLLSSWQNHLNCECVCSWTRVARFTQTTYMQILDHMPTHWGQLAWDKGCPPHRNYKNGYLSDV